MSKCKSCGAEIIWVKTKSGKSMPCDAQRKYFHENGDLGFHYDDKEMETFITEDGETKRGWEDEYAGDYAGYTPHWATCPNANQHRKRDRK